MGLSRAHRCSPQLYTSSIQHTKFAAMNSLLQQQPVKTTKNHHQHLHAAHFKQQQQQQVQAKTNQTNPLMGQPEGSAQMLKKLMTFFYVYAILIVSIYILYAGCQFFLQRNKLQLATADLSHSQSSQFRSASESSTTVEQSVQNLAELDAKFENKIHLLERYIELVALELEEAKSKLREREKCDCQQSCTFNGTRFADLSSWTNQCDICTCQSGRISCQAKKCPSTDCDVAIQLPGQCCPTCMKKCKHNNATFKHGQLLDFIDKNKECKCQDGLIKCQAKRKSGAGTSSSEQLKSSLTKLISRNSTLA